MFGDRFSSSTTCSRWRHETEPGRLDQSLSCRFWKVATHPIIDSTGRSIAGEGEWATAQHGGRGTRGWNKLHVGVDHTGVIVAHARTDATVDDATTGVELIEAVNDDIARVTADAAYDTVGCYDAAGARGAPVVVPPTKTARVSRRRPRSSARDHTINTVKSLGRRRWKQTSRDHQHARVENACFRYQSTIVGSVSAQATITRDPSTPRWSFLQPRRPRPPCFAAAHSPSPTMDSPVLSTMRCRLVPGRARRSARARC